MAASTGSAFRSVLPSQAWPGALGGHGARIAGVLHQLAASQWWPAERLRAAQLRQAQALLGHAGRHVPVLRRRLREAGFDPERALTEEAWTRIPVLRRGEVQAFGAGLRASVVPPEHGAIEDHTTGGSSGVPVRITGTAVQMDVYSAATCRLYDWHGIDVRLPAARIRGNPDTMTAEQVAAASGPGGLALASYGPPLDWLYETGPLFQMASFCAPGDQAALLSQRRVAMLGTLPSVLRVLLSHVAEASIALPELRHVLTTSEVVDPALRVQCREVTGARLVDTYSANDTGLMATQCPLHEHYHVAAESCLLEVLDDRGRACGPGEVGEVVVTPLHNFATPLIRYALGDLAEAGAPCPCGRGLPVLNRIIGRTTDRLVLADGSRRGITISYFQDLPAIREFQLVQTVPGAVTVHLNVSRALAPEEAERVIEQVRRRTGPGVDVHLAYRDSLPRTAAGKLRVFACEVPGTAP